MKDLIKFLEAKQSFILKKHVTNNDGEYVDLELPSGTKWAACNLGAEKPEDQGLLFQWGRTDGYKYGDKNHRFLSYKNYMPTSGTRYKKGDILKSEDDASYQSSNGKFRIPTKDEIDELVKYTDKEWTALNNVMGMKFISIKNKSKYIFIPVGGYYSAIRKTFCSNSTAGIWSSYASLDFTAFELQITEKSCCNMKSDLPMANYIRPVLNK